MMSNASTPKVIPTARTVAAIDIGSNLVRMVIAQVLADGRIEVLERLQRAVRLGQDTFRRGRLGAQSMRAAVAVMRDYRAQLDLYHVEEVRAVATSAVREAANTDTFLDRILMATGLNVEVVDTSEESRLTVSAMREAIGEALGLNRAVTLVADVGGGSTLLTVLDGDEIVNSQSLRLGSVRLQEWLSTRTEPAERSAELLHHHISNVIATARGFLPLEEVRTFIALGGDARFAARQIGDASSGGDLYAVDVGAFDKLVRRCAQRSPEELAKRYNLPFADAETLSPALLIYQVLLQAAGAKQMIVSQVTMRDGLLLELARKVTGEEDTAIAEGVVHAATSIVEKYHGDLGHVQDVAELAVRLFDFLQAEHGLKPRYRLLLRVAGLLHEIGGFVSPRAHHKHSYYLISNSEIFGLSVQEMAVVALVARYHRRSVPKPSHLEYISQPREVRVVVNKLAALLRVADALVRGHMPQSRQIRFDHQGDELVVHVPGGTDVMLEERSIAGKGDLFEDIYGMKIRLEGS